MAAASPICMPEGLVKDGFDENLVYQSFPLLALFGRAATVFRCPLLGVEQT
jgi:hypothetical protein